MTKPPSRVRPATRPIRPKGAGRIFLAFACIIWGTLLALPAPAAELYHQGDVSLRVDTSLGYSASVRLGQADAVLLADPNGDDGDRNFATGIVSNRLDLSSQLDLSLGDYGIRISGQGWYDSIYRRSNDNNSPATFNPFSVPHDHFTRAVETLHGLDAELLDAFVHGAFEIAGRPLTLRIGQHSLIWGESLFFADNGIAAGQAPVDEIKLANQPGLYARDVFLPVAQVSATVQLSPSLALSAYNQFSWRRNRLPGSGSYFSDYDFLGAGGERYILSPGRYLYRIADERPPDLGQFGFALQSSDADFSYGLYVLRFHSKDPEVSLKPSGASGANAGSYQLVYPEGIELYGASFSTYVSDFDLAGEFSLRRNMPLVSSPITVPPGGKGDFFPVGDTLHAQFSTVETFEANGLWDRADLDAEVAASQVLAITRNAGARDRTRDWFSAAVRATLEPQYFEVLPDLDLGIPIGVGWTPGGGSSTDENQTPRSGDVEAGVSATYRVAWHARLGVTYFFGNPLDQPYADRNFFSFSVGTTF